MFETFGAFVRTLVRPLVTFGLGAATVERTVAGDLDGAKFLGTFFGIAMTFWFVGRATSPEVDQDPGDPSVRAIGFEIPPTTGANGTNRRTY